MAAQRGNMTCHLYQGAFSGEVVYEVKTLDGQTYEGIVPKHYAVFKDDLSSQPVLGQVKVFVLENGGNRARVRMPDGEAVEVSPELIT